MCSGLLDSLFACAPVSRFCRVWKAPCTRLFCVLFLRYLKYNQIDTRFLPHDVLCKRHAQRFRRKQHTCVMYLARGGQKVLIFAQKSRVNLVIFQITRKNWGGLFANEAEEGACTQLRKQSYGRTPGVLWRIVCAPAARAARCQPAGAFHCILQ